MSIQDQIDNIKKILEETSEKFDDMASDVKLALQEKYETLRKNYHGLVAKMSDDEKNKAYHQLEKLEAILSEKGYKGKRISEQ